MVGDSELGPQRQSDICFLRQAPTADTEIFLSHLFQTEDIETFLFCTTFWPQTQRHYSHITSRPNTQRYSFRTTSIPKTNTPLLHRVKLKTNRYSSRTMSRPKTQRYSCRTMSRPRHSFSALRSDIRHRDINLTRCPGRRHKDTPVALCQDRRHRDSPLLHRARPQTKTHSPRTMSRTKTDIPLLHNAQTGNTDIPLTPCPDRRYRYPYSYSLPRPYRFWGQATACVIETNRLLPKAKKQHSPSPYTFKTWCYTKKRGNLIIPPTSPIRKFIWTKRSQCLVVSTTKISPLHSTN